MNLGQAVALCLYELVRNKSVPTRTGGKTEKILSAKAAEIERLTLLLLELLTASGYTHSESKDELKLRHLVRRLVLTSHDAETWLGMMRQILWKLRDLQKK